jgi:LPS export ABC transporter protein LptC
LILLIIACDREESKISESTETEIIPDQEIEGYVLRETSSGELKWILRSDYMAMYSEKKLIKAKNVKIDFIGEDGELSSVLTADEGELHSESRNMVARGNVKVISSDSDSLLTEEIEWLNDREVIQTDKQVVLIRKGNRVESLGMESDPALRHIRLKKHISGNFSGLDMGEDDF